MTNEVRAITDGGLVRGFVDSPLGRLRLVACEEGLVRLELPEHTHAVDLAARDVARHRVLDRARDELDEYFAGSRRHFTTPLSRRGGTTFQLAVWRALMDIPFGETRSYGELARQIGRPRAVRAVGAANAHNPLSIVIPCHRVIGAGGALTGYAGGIGSKRWLLDHERRACGASEMPLNLET